MHSITRTGAAAILLNLLLSPALLAQRPADPLRSGFANPPQSAKLPSGLLSSVTFTVALRKPRHE